MRYKGVAPAIACSQKSLGVTGMEVKFLHETYGYSELVDVFGSSQLLLAHLRWAREALEKLTDSEGKLIFDTIITPLHCLGGTLVPFALQFEVIRRGGMPGEVSILRVDPNWKREYWFDRRLQTYDE